jgi:hypothetical protein
LAPTTSSVIAPGPVVNPNPASSAPAVSAQASLTAVSRITVSETTRAVPQSERDVLLKVQSFVSMWTPSTLAEKMTAAKTITSPGYAEMIDNLVRMSELLQKIGTTH